MIRATMIIALVALGAMPAAADICPQCGRDHGVTVNVSVNSSAQAVAQARANYAARYRLRNHPRRGVVGFAQVASFEGFGWSTSSMPPTCIPGRRGGVRDTSSSAWVLVGDATARGRDGLYRIRLWRRR